MSLQDQLREISISEYLTTAPSDTDIFCLRFSDDGAHVVAGCGDGSIRVFSALNGKLVYNISTKLETGGYPMTCVRFRPVTAKTKTRNVILAANSSGIVQHWHVTSGKCISSINEEPNQVYAVDYRPDAAYFVTAGKDWTLRVYDEATKSLAYSMYGGHGNVTAGHSNRVFSVKFHPRDPNIIVTGGWDNTVQIWDIREDHAVRSIFGPHICGDAVDLRDDVLLTGSWRPEDQLQVWDFATGSCMQSIPIKTSGIRSESNMLYSAQLSPSGSLIAACGSGANEAKIIHRATGEELLNVEGEECAFYTCDFSPDGTKVAYSGAGGRVHIYEIHAVE